MIHYIKNVNLHVFFFLMLRVQMISRRIRQRMETSSCVFLFVFDIQYGTAGCGPNRYKSKLRADFLTAFQVNLKNVMQTTAANLLTSLLSTIPVVKTAIDQS